MTCDERFFEVKAGPASAMEFTWFQKIFPKKQLTVICETPFESDHVTGLTLEQFLLSGETDLYYDEDKFRFPE